MGLPDPIVKITTTGEAITMEAINEYTYEKCYFPTYEVGKPLVNPRKTKIVKVPSLATARKKSISKKTKKEEKKDFASVLEYYDLPYRYNETVVKILAQTPKILFVYWDISDSDREKYVEKYGE